VRISGEPSIGPSTAAGSDPRVVGATLFFRAWGNSSSGTGYELWKSDGSYTGTVLVKDIQPGLEGSSPGPFTGVNGVAFFPADDGVHGVELWRSDGTESGTALVKDIEPPLPASSTPTSLTVSGSMLYFTAWSPATGTELFASDGSEAGTLSLDVWPGTQSSSPSALTPFDGDLLFWANGGAGWRLWRSDGTPAGTLALGGSRSSVDRTPTPLVVGGTCYFAFDGDLWKTDGTAPGTSFVHGVSPFYYSNFAAVGGTIFFAGSAPSSPGSGVELWKSDGSAAGTELVKDIRPGSASSTPTALAVLDGIVYFAADDGAHGAELWRSDGTEAGTYLVKDVRPGANGGLAQSPERVVFDGGLYFSARDGQSGIEPWRSDGSKAGTQLLRDIAPGGDGWAGLFTAANGLLYFLSVEDPLTYATGLWETDGTPSGTVRVGSAGSSSSGSPVRNVDGKVFFSGCDYGAGCEVWTSDGTSPGTWRVADVHPGVRSSYPAEFAVLGGQVYSAATGATSGTELWRLPLAAVPDADGLYDASEASFGTFPDDADSDDDGLSDHGELVRHGTDPLAGDSDGDGFGDGVELAAGSDPLDPGSVPPDPVELPLLAPWGRALLAGGVAWLRRR
jgi:ELWxxDGT repeat protein